MSEQPSATARTSAALEVMAPASPSHGGPLLLVVDAPLFPHCTMFIPWNGDGGWPLVAGDRLLVIPGHPGDAGDLKVGAGSPVGSVATLAEVLSVTSSAVEVHGLYRVTITATADPVDALRAYWEELDEKFDEPAVANLARQVRQLARRCEDAESLQLWDDNIDLDDPEPFRLACRLAQSLRRPAQRHRAFVAPDLASLLREERLLLRRRLRRSHRRDGGHRFGPTKAESIRAQDNESPEARALRAVPEALRPTVQRDIDSGADYRALEYIATFPWADPVIPALDIAEVEAALGRSHAAMPPGAKQAVLDTVLLADRRRQQGLPAIGGAMLLHGPAGVGKSSFVNAIAAATGRAHIRIAVGSDRDTIRFMGLSRAWHGSDIGEITKGLIGVGTRYALIQFDEIDKVAQGGDGRDVQAMLLQLTDPGQNGAVRDVFLQLPTDLSPVLFAFTCNRLEMVSPPLRDRCTTVELPGYTPVQKRALIASHLWPRLLAENAIGEDALALSAEAQDAVAARHEMEPGLRGVERDLRTLAMRALHRLSTKGTVTIGVGDVIRELGGTPQPFFVPPSAPPPGQCLILATAGSAGVVLPLQIVTWPGSGRIRTSGLLGPEFQQVITTCLGYLRVHGQVIGIAAEDLDRIDIHVHLPGGGVTKEGPSAGAAILAALVSVLTGKPIPGDIAVTGEVDLHGNILPVGALPAKLISAQAANIHTVLVPAGNHHDDPLSVPVTNVMEVFRHLGLIDQGSGDEPRASRPPTTSRQSRPRTAQPGHCATTSSPDGPSGRTRSSPGDGCPARSGSGGSDSTSRASSPPPPPVQLAPGSRPAPTTSPRRRLRRSSGPVSEPSPLTSTGGAHPSSMIWADRTRLTTPSSCRPSTGRPTCSPPFAS